MRVKEIDLGVQGTIFLGFCWRRAYGKSRRRIVVYRSQQNVLFEFVGTDHYQDRSEIICRLKEPESNKSVRPGDAVPVEYVDFDLVRFRDHVTGPKAPNVMGVLVSEGDTEAIIALSLIRENHKRQAPRIRVKCNPFTGRSPESPDSKPVTAEDQVPEVVKAILEFGLKLDFEDCPFTDEPDANSLIVENSFAFLLAAALDRGATAERIWAIPYHLKGVLGHLDPGKIKEMQPAELREILGGLQSKPRYVDAASKTVVDVSTKVTDILVAGPRRYGKTEQYLKHTGV